MSFVAKSLILSLSIAAAMAADKNSARDAFRVEPAEAYPNRQTNEKVVIAAEPYDSPEKAKAAFGKVNPNQFGVLPVLIVIHNGNPRALDLHQMRIEYITPDRKRVEATPAKDVRYLRSPGRPPVAGPEPPRRGPLPTGRGGKRNPLDTWEIEGRAFAPKMLPAGESAHGFFYFQTRPRPGSRIYITGLREAGTQRELLYFEIQLP